jgi:hypothetical protein
MQAGHLDEDEAWEGQIRDLKATIAGVGDRVVSKLDELGEVILRSD